MNQSDINKEIKSIKGDIQGVAHRVESLLKATEAELTLLWQQETAAKDAAILVIRATRQFKKICSGFGVHYELEPYIYKNSQRNPCYVGCNIQHNEFSDNNGYTEIVFMTNESDYTDVQDALRNYNECANRTKQARIAYNTISDMQRSLASLLDGAQEHRLYDKS